MDVVESWEKIEHWIARNAPAERLANGAPSEELEELEKSLWVRIPEDLRCSLQLHNGSADAEIIPPAFSLWGTSRIISEYATEHFQRERVYVPVGSMGPTRLVIDSRSNRLAQYDPHYGFFSRDEKVLSSRFGEILSAVAQAISSSPAVLRVSPDEVWRARASEGPSEGYLVWEDE
ncbi:SMI1/KNR4 family protein [Streptomyces rubiginosohelvolus]|uniref:SMI1/KNR4 family protein n=1 Tax=Streptomyces rubiginosohelvolus TaxID=67362 RepID=UPI00367EF846